MSTTNDDEQEIFIDPNEKSDYRRGRRSSVQFIDKSLIRRRSSGNDKQPQQPSRPILGSTFESDARDHLQNYSEKIVFFICSQVFCFLFLKKIFFFLLLFINF